MHEKVDAYNPKVITPIVTKYNWPIFTKAELDLLVQGTHELLEAVGVHFPLEKALDIFAEHGAQVDRDTQIVRIPHDLVVKAMSTQPRFFGLGGRDPDYDFHLQENHSFFSTSGSSAFIIDLETRKKRYSTKEDVAQMARVADYLAPIAFYWPLVSAGDYGEMAPLHEVHATFLNCRKHVQTETVMGEMPARYAVEMALVLSGDRETMRARPPLSSLICTIAPLGHDTHGLESALVFAEAGLPVGFMAMNQMMTSGPASPVGMLVTGNAEILSALVLIQLAYPGARTFFSFFPSTMDPRTTRILDHTPWSNLMYAGGVELAHAQGVSSLSLGGGSSALEPGWQYAKEDATFVSVLAGSEMMLRFGTMDSGAVAHPEAIILDCDKLKDDRITAAGLSVTREAMALDVIRNVGPRGTFLMEDHTIQNLRKIPLSDLVMETRRQERVHADGIVETAWEQVKWIVENHKPPPVDKAVARELTRIMEAASREIVGI